MGLIKQDYKIAVQYYEKAIKHEVMDAYCNLGSIFVLGTGMEQGVPRNVERGADFWLLALMKAVASALIHWALYTEKASSSPKI
ncbi:hypothetical protein [Polynucleobacter sp. MWH-UH2A]|uniref:hypothetical protein n=1 Tax=Polynucleobacter sp. MWH-UH2A TaxID=1855617 RepID=UPI001BFE80F7|nr:hypothetical protein IC571_04645 [Polynucleobacter sp. MWH-UH2A]